MKRPKRFDILSIFPGMFGAYLDESMIKRAKARELLDIRAHDLRDWAVGKHHKVDERPFGGGPGMLLRVEPIYRALKDLTKGSKKKPYVLLMSPRGTRLTHKVAERLAKHDRVVMICGRYEGVDQRVTDHLVDEEISIGDYVLTGGELPALVDLDCMARFIPGVVGKTESIKDESHSKEGYIEYPHYTRPEVFSPKKGVSWKVPKVLLSGDHAKVAEWREKMAVTRKKASD